MSDPVKSMDVEDVLSSIRRLVSEEAKGSGFSNESSPATDQIDIHEEAENAVSEALADMARGSDTRPEAHAGTPPSNEFSAEGVAPVGTDEAGGVSEPTHEISFRHQSMGARANDAQKLVLTAALRVAEPEKTDTVSSAPTAEPDVPEMAEVKATVTPKRPERPHLRPVAVETEEPLDKAAPIDRSKPFDYAPEDTLFDRAKRAMEAVRENQPQRGTEHPPVTAPAPATETLSTSEILHAAFDPNASDEDFVTETETETASLKTPMGHGSASPFSATGRVLEPEQDTPVADTEDEPSTINFAEEDESILDEDTLRDIVSEMVREELQGELGDRITRNVRKLVRREIQRALASREFE